MKHASTVATSLTLAILGVHHADDTRAQAPPAQTANSARAAAPVDLTGYWVSVVSEDWRWRMVTPLKGDFSNIPVNARAREVGQRWDPAIEEAAGGQCKAYGAPVIMREPGRLRISWRDDETLEIEMDSGMQTRLLRFKGGPAEDDAPQLQGYSAAKWQDASGRRSGGFGLGLGVRGGRQSRTLEVVTTRLQPGYLRKNGIPYSQETRMTEYFDLFKDPDGVDWFVVTGIVEDPVYLNAPWVTTSHFRREPNGSKWHPQPCSLR